MRSKVSASSHNGTVAPISWRCVGIFAFAHGPPHGRNEVIFGNFAIVNQACASLADTYSWTRQIISETLNVLVETSKLELRHRLFVRS